MRIFTLLLTGLLLMTASHSALATPVTAPGQAPRVVRLENGLTVLVRQDKRFPLVSLRLYVRAGSAYEDPGEAGISHMLEHMVFKGTAKRPKGRVAADIERTGGYLNAATSFDYTVYLTDMTREHWKTGLDVLKDMGFDPSLDPEELESEKDVVVAELKRGEDNPDQRLFRMMQQIALKGTPYQRPIIGYEETVRGLSSEMMRAYIARLYQPQSMLLLICGDVDPDEVIAEAKRLFGDRKNTHPVIPPANIGNALQTDGFTATVEKGPWNKVYLSLALPAPALSDASAAQLDVLAQLLGGDATSRFYRTYKYDKRLVDTISAANYSFERLGMLYIQATMDADKLIPFWETFTHDLARLAVTTFSNEELERAKLNLEDDLLRSKETLSGLASKLGYFTLFAGGEQGEENYLRMVQNTNQTVLLDLVTSLFSPEALSMTVLLPEDAALADLLPKGGDATARHAKADSWEAWFQATLTENWSASPRRQTASATEGTAGQPEIVDLGKGRTLVLLPDDTLPYTAMNLVYTGGNALLNEKNQGLAAFTASLLTKGTKELSATAVEDYLSDRAADLSISAGRQTFNFSMSAPARFTDDMFSLLYGTLRKPAFRDEEAERVRENQIAAITMREDQPTGLAFRRIFPFLFKDHVYGYLQLGEKDRVAEFTAKDAREFWKTQSQQPWVLSVSGSYDRDAILEAAQQLPAPGTKETVPGAAQWNSGKTLDLRLPGRNQGHLFMIFPTVGYGAPDEPGLELLQNILSGQSGLLFRDLRDRQGLGYTVAAFPWKAEKTGALIFYIGTEPDKMQQAEEGFQKVIADLRERLLPQEELDRGKNQMEGDYYRDHQTLASRSAEAAGLTVLHRPLDAARKLVEQARAVNAATLQQLARTYLDPDKAYIVTVLP